MLEKAEQDWNEKFICQEDQACRVIITLALKNNWLQPALDLCGQQSQVERCRQEFHPFLGVPEADLKSCQEAPANRIARL